MACWRVGTGLDRLWLRTRRESNAGSVTTMTTAGKAGTCTVKGSGVHSDRVIENPRSGERVEFVSDTSEALTMLTTWTRPGHRAIEHIHPNMQERFEVLAGRAAFRVDGVEIVAAAGEVVVAPAGSRHLAWNPTDAPVRLKIEMRPGPRWAEFTRRLFQGEDARELLGDYSEIVSCRDETFPGFGHSAGLHAGAHVRQGQVASR